MPVTKCSGLIAYVKSLSTFTLVGMVSCTHRPPCPREKLLPPRTRWAEDWMGCSSHRKIFFSSPKSNLDPPVIKAVVHSQNRLRCLANICPYLATELRLYEPKPATKLSGSNPSLLYAVQTEFMNTELIHNGFRSEGLRQLHIATLLGYVSVNNLSSCLR
jgi:hypothetical protein